MCTDKRRISDIRNLNCKPGRRVLFVSVCLIMAFCFCVPCFATGAEILEYEDTFNDNNSLAVVRISREINYNIDDSNCDTVTLDDYYQSYITESQIAIFSQTEWDTIYDKANSGNGVNAYISVDIVINVDLVYRHYENESATFPVQNATSFSIKQFHAYCDLSPISTPDNWTLGGYQYSLPGSSAVYDGTGNDTSGSYIISLYVPGNTSGLFYHNSIQLKNFYGTFSYNSGSFATMNIPILEFSFSNIYQYTLNAVETTQTLESTQLPETSAPVFVPGVDTAVPSDTMQGNPDDIDNVLDYRYQDFVNNYTDILNGFSWVKYAGCFGFIGQFFGKVFQIEPFADILNSWAIFAVFNILLGGFITGVSAYVRMQIRENEKKEREAQNEIRREKMRGFWSRFYRNFGNHRGRHDD